ncbi:autotransporter-associated beta strand repeat-containing protein [Prosthecobacter sp.]|uniref:beta strand repeat-containing protein n=1 Tax=Prosthecobacter sp. TaxID=1965333 RepID=UPI0024894388|nr:autotransporter-associated beta strand repeat-containing protein [Prosthecobacter sp.]MDI1314511.1 autotransporter-associated beta strand repeat-containing protein [Prosthecobacter sp.]
MFLLRQGSFSALVALACAALCGAPAPLRAATLLWVGDVDAAWNTNTSGNTNWSTDLLPAASGDLLTFGSAGASGTTLNNDIVGLSIAGLTFNAGADAFTLAGNALTLSGSLTNNSSSLEVLSMAVSLGASSSINATGGGISFGAALSSAASDLSITGSGVITFSGLNFASTANKITSTGADVRFVGGSTIAADVLISSGTVGMESGAQVFNNGLKVDGASSVLNFKGASVTVNGIGGGSSGEQDSLEILNGGTLNVSAGTVDLTPSRFWMQTGTLNVIGGTMNLNSTLIAQLPGAIARINVSGGSLSLTAGNRFANNGTAILTVSGTGAVTWGAGGTGLSENGTGSIIMNGGTLNMTSSGTTYLYLNGGNGAGFNTAVTSSIAFNAGVLSTRGFAMNPGANSTNRLAELRFNGGTLKATDNNSATNFIPYSVNLTSKVQAGGAVIDTNGFSINIADNLEHDSALGATVDGGLTKNGLGTLTVSGANTYTGATTINAGTLNIVNNTGGTVTYSGLISGLGGTLTLSGANTLNFTGGLSMTNVASTLLVTGSDVRVNSDGTFNVASVTVNSGGALRFQSGTESFMKGLVASGAGTILSFEGANVTHNGNGDGNGNNGLQLDTGATMNVSAGTVVFNNINRAFIQTSTINVTGGALTINNALYAQGVGTASVVNVSAGSLTMGGATRFANNGSATLTVSGTGAVTWASGSYGLSENGTANVVMNGGTLNMTSSGSSYFYLNGGNSAASNVSSIVSTISLNAGVLSTRGFAMNTSSGASSAGSNRLAELRFNGGTLRATDNNGAANFIPDSANLTSKVQAGGAVIDTNGFNITIADSLEHDSALGATADGGLTKNGTGTLTLTAANTYTGKTTVAAGTLALSGAGAVASSPWIEVKSGATLNVTAVTGGTQTLSNQVLSGTGSVTGTVVIGAGSILKPGNSTDGSLSAVANAGDGSGTLTFTNLTLATGASESSPRALLTLSGTSSHAADPTVPAQVSAFKDSGAGGLYDSIKVTGALGLNAGSTIKVELAAGYTPTWGDVFNIVDWATLNANADGLSGAFTVADLVVPTNLGNGWFFATDQFMSNGIIYVVPEPSRMLLLAVGLLVLAGRRKR